MVYPVRTCVPRTVRYAVRTGSGCTVYVHKVTQVSFLLLKVVGFFSRSEKYEREAVSLFRSELELDLLQICRTVLAAPPLFNV